MHRPIRIVVPFKLDGAKSRLSSVLQPQERRLLALAMLGDVLKTVREFGSVTILSRPGLNAERLRSLDPVFGADNDAENSADNDIDNDADNCSVHSTGEGIDIRESEKDLNDAINELIEREAADGWHRDILIVMADLALLAKNDIVGIINCPGDVVLCPGRGGGTNMILINSPEFRTCYRKLSFSRHLDFARKAGLDACVFESFRAGSDIDEPEDLVELLLHGRGEARKLIEKMGFAISDEVRASTGKAPVMRRSCPADIHSPM